LIWVFDLGEKMITSLGATLEPFVARLEPEKIQKAQVLIHKIDHKMTKLQELHDPNLLTAIEPKKAVELLTIIAGLAELLLKLWEMFKGAGFEQASKAIAGVHEVVSKFTSNIDLGSVFNGITKVAKPAATSLKPLVMAA
jgi:hypothetical protein